MSPASAPNEPHKFGYMTLNSTIKGDYEGKLYHINPKGGKTLGLRAYPSLSEVSDKIDAVVIIVPVVTKEEIMGYSVNRIWRAIKKESLFLEDQGYSDPESIDRGFMLLFGTPYDPFGIMDAAGYLYFFK